MKIYQVGGAVRDRLLGRAIIDRDWVVVGATPELMESLGYRRVGKDFPVFLHPETKEEYALARTERKTGRGYGGFTFNTSADVTLEQDLARRDVTINAMAEDEHGNLIDPYNGKKDLEEGVLRHIGPAFVEDPLRVLRVCRFAARYAFQIAEDTRRLLTQISASGELSDLPAERIWVESEKGLNEAHPDIFLQTMRDCGALKQLLPEVDCLFGIPQPANHHPEIDTGEHICLALKQAADFKAPSSVRFAVLLHDVGKGLTPAEILPKHIDHEQRGLPLVEAICSRLKVPKEFKTMALAVAAHHVLVHRVQEMRPSKQLQLLEKLDALRRPERFEQILLACKIDATGRTGKQSDPYPQLGYLKGARDAVKAVSATALKERGLDGADFLAALTRERLAALKAYSANYTH